MSAYAWPGIDFSAYAGRADYVKAGTIPAGVIVADYTSGNGGTIARSAEPHEPPMCGKCGAEHCELIAVRSAALTTREREIIKGVVQALSNKDISVKFNISEQTVKNHLHNIFEKLAIYSRLELALYALHQGMHI